MKKYFIMLAMCEWSYCKNEEKWYNVSKIKLIVAGTAAKQSAQKREWYDDCKRYSQRSGCYQYYS